MKSGLWKSSSRDISVKRRMLGGAVEGRLLGLNGGMGEKIETESTPFGGTFGPKGKKELGW